MAKAREGRDATPMFLPNPTADWGPKQRAQGFATRPEDSIHEKRSALNPNP